MAEILNLQELEAELVDTPAEGYHSDNSAYACVLISAYSVGCR